MNRNAVTLQSPGSSRSGAPWVRSPTKSGYAESVTPSPPVASCRHRHWPHPRSNIGVPLLARPAVLLPGINRSRPAIPNRPTSVVNDRRTPVSVVRSLRVCPLFQLGEKGDPFPLWRNRILALALTRPIAPQKIQKIFRPRRVPLNYLPRHAPKECIEPIQLYDFATL
jgi:hypothetical protein